MGLAYAGTLPKFDLQLPQTRMDAAGEASAKLGLSWMRDLHETNVHNVFQALGIYVRMGLTPLGLLAGTGYGAIAGESASKLDPALNTLSRAIHELQVDEMMRSQLLFLLHQRSVQPVVLLTNLSTADTVFRVPSLMDEYAPLPFSFATQQPSKDCASPAFEGLDTVLLIRVVNHGLSGRHGYNSGLAVNVVVVATLIRPQDRTQLFNFYAQYDSAKKSFIEWGANDAQAFRAEMERALQSVTQQILSKSGLQVPRAPQPTGIAQATFK